VFCVVLLAVPLVSWARSVVVVPRYNLSLAVWVGVIALAGLDAKPDW